MRRNLAILHPTCRWGRAAGLALAGLLAGCSTPPSAAHWTVTPTKPGTRAQVSQASNRVTVDLWSESGIGSADLLCAAGAKPAKVELRLHLRGLESLRVSHDGREVQIAVSSTAQGAIMESLKDGGQPERPLAAPSPLWLPVRIVSRSGGAAAIPLADGYFVVVLPADWGRAGGITKLDWVDFWR